MSHVNEFVVLDKSYLEGASGQEIRELASCKKLLMPSALFYELMTTSPEQRRKCFRKLPPGDNPVTLVEHIGILLTHEVATGSPAGLPSDHCIKFPFQFNTKLLNDDYQLPPDALDAVNEQTQEVEEDIERLINFSETMGQLFPDGLLGRSNLVEQARRTAFSTIADAVWIHAFYDHVRANASEVHPCPEIKGAPMSWAHIRWLQVNLIFALDLHIRHGGRLRRNLTPDLRLRLEHDVHDAQLLVFGVLQGALATREKKLTRWHALLLGTDGGVCRL